jgi:hypothetical protein
MRGRLLGFEKNGKNLLQRDRYPLLELNAVVHNSTSRL